MELRLLLAFVLMGVVLFVTPYFYKTVSPPVKKTAPVGAKSEPATAATGAGTAPAETAQDKKLRHIPDNFISRHFRPSLH